MLSYRHAFHAGNFADVLKHLTLIQLIDYLSKKDKGFCYIDTHAGAGSYALHSDYALKNREFDNGIGKLWQRTDLPAEIAQYVNLIQQINQGKQLHYYPGSPVISQTLLRQQDRLILFELHSTEIKLLSNFVKKDARVKVLHEDGLSNSLTLLPPIERRGLVLIDPSYEIKSDYIQVFKTLEKMYQRFATGTYALWYPVIERQRILQLERNFKNSEIKNIQLFELGLCADATQPGMTACGMIVINPPWTLKSQMEQILPWLVAILTEQKGYYRIEQLIGE